MRIVYDLQLSLDSVPMEEIEINPNRRDKMDSFFSAVRQIFLDDSTRERLFQLLEQYYKPDTRKDCGRPGMMLWRYPSENPYHCRFASPVHTIFATNRSAKNRIIVRIRNLRREKLNNLKTILEKMLNWQPVDKAPFSGSHLWTLLNDHGGSLCDFV